MFAGLAFGLLTVGCLLDLTGRAPAWSVADLPRPPSWPAAVFPAAARVAAVRRGKLDINALMVIAVARRAWRFGEWEEAAMVVSLFAVAQWLEAQSLDRARAAIRSLLDLAPAEALDSRRRAANGSSTSIACCPAQRMIVRPGERVALDGTVTRRPVRREPGADHRRVAAGGEGGG